MFVAIATAALSASAAYSQSLPISALPGAGSIPSGLTSGLASLSAECRSTVLGLVSSPLVECLSLSTLAPALSPNASLTPILDEWMTDICSANACDQELLDSTAQNISMACGSDVAQFDVSGTDIQEIFGLYPLVREMLCLKTTEPFMSNSTMTNSTMTNSTMTDNATMTDSSMSTNSTNGTFCVTSLLTEVTDYLGMNLTVTSIIGLVMGNDTEGRQALSEIPPSALCQDCIYAGAGLIEQQYPGIWNHTIGSGSLNVSGFLNQTCMNETFPEIDRSMNSTDGSEGNNTITLPDAIFPSAENSTYPYPIVFANGTYSPNVTLIQQAPALPFVNLAPAAVEEGAAPTATAYTSLMGPSASASATSMTSAAAASVTSAAGPSLSSAAALPSLSSAASAAASAAPVKRDVTAAKRRWVGQQ